MKRILSFVAVMLGLMALSSCMKESIETGQEGSINGTFTISVPQDVVTKAYGDGKFATKNMIIGVFDEKGDVRYRKIYEWGPDKFTETITLPFVMGKSYQMVFWAQYGNAYGDPKEMELKEITMPYAGSNQENLDAFYWYEPKFTVTEDFSKNITMRRPFAQVNFATTPGDIDESIAAGLDVKLGDKAVVTVKNAAKTLNLFTGETSDYAEVSVPATEFPKDANGKYHEITVEGKTYEILAMNYFLVADKDAVDGKTTAEMSLMVGELELSVPQAQMKRNYRTNIVGELLTGEGTFNVTIDPIFGGDFNHNGITGDGTEEIKPAFAALASEKNAAKIDAKGGQYYMNVTSNVAWTVTVPQGLTATPASGDKNAEVAVTVPENTTDKDVTYEVAVKTTAEVATKEYKFTITQAAAAPVTPDPDPEEPEEPAGPQVVTVAQFLAAEVGDTEYKLTGVIEGTYNTTYGNFYLNDGTAKVVVYGLTATKVSSNDKSFATLGLRDGDTVTLIGTRDDYEGTPQVGGPAYYVSHIAAPYLTVPATAAVDATATTYSINVEANVAWTATASTGATLDVTSGNGNGTVTMTFAANTTSEPVTYTVAFAGEGLNKTFTLTQKAVPAADADPRYVKVSAEQQDWSGEYLIVWDNKAHATLSSKDLIATADVTIVADEIAATAELEKAVMTVTKSGDKYVMTLPNGSYFGMAKNSCKEATTEFALTFEYSDAGVKISGTTSDGTFILYHNSNNGNFYRCYADKKGQAGYTLPALYKYTE